MIQVEKLTYGFPAKDLYKDISFTLEAGRHCALIGSNGTGKSTLADMLIDPDKYLYDGKIIRDEGCRIGYAGQFTVRDKAQDMTVFQYLSERFLKNQQAITDVCEEMAVAESVDELFEKYQQLLDIHEAMDGDNYESNIRKELYLAGMSDLEETGISLVSGGEYKMLQIMREMLVSPDLLILDGPDVFLDFGNLGGLCQLINSYKGTLLAITHNRYLLDHCFDKILDLENCDIQEYDGNYSEYHCTQLQEKLKLKRQNLAEREEIRRTEEMVERLRDRATLMVNPTIGRSVNAKQSQLDSLLARHIKAPFVQIREPEIKLPVVEPQGAGPVLTIEDYEVAFDKSLLENVSFQLLAGEKVAIVGANGTGKTTLLRDILSNEHPAVHIADDVRCACLSQLQGENMDEDKTVYELMEDAGLGTKKDIRAFLSGYCIEEDCLDRRLSQLSGGEQNLLQIAMLAVSDAQLLILDEPTSQLDIYAQTALEKALAEYRGTVIMVSHDFYLVSGCADYVLFVEDNTIRRMGAKKFRRLVYGSYFEQSYLAVDRRKQELEKDINQAFKKNDLAAAEKLCAELASLALPTQEAGE